MTSLNKLLMKYKQELGECLNNIMKYVTSVLFYLFTYLLHNCLLI